MVDGTLTQRTLFLDLPGTILDVIVGEVTVGTRSTRAPSRSRPDGTTPSGDAFERGGVEVWRLGHDERAGRDAAQCEDRGGDDGRDAGDADRDRGLHRWLNQPTSGPPTTVLPSPRML